MTYDCIHPGVFQARPNRFIAMVELDGETRRCHVPNTGRLRELLLPGAVVWCQFHPEPGRKTAWTLLAVEHRGTVVNIDSQIPNRLAADFVRSGGLGPVPDLVKPEQTFGDSRLDLYYEAGPVRGFAEVKGVTLNGATLGLVLCMLACGVAGSHPGNVWPIMVGYVVMSFVAKWLFVGESYILAINAQAILTGLCFANGLSPIAGKYGWGAGIVAGMLHYTLVTCVPALHGGYLLYNGGFTACLVCIFFVPALERFLRLKEEAPAQSA